MSYHLLIVDDEPLARQRLKRLLSSESEFTPIAEAENGQEALDWLSRNSADLVLMDIQMPGLDGMQAAEKIALFENPPGIIFCTAYDDQAISAFAVDAIDYLLKPVHKEDLVRALTRAKVRLKQMSDRSSKEARKHISTKTHMGLKRIPIESIYYFNADQKYLSVYHQEGEDLIDETLKQLEEEFPNQFLRIHRSILVAVNQIEKLTQGPEGVLLHLQDMKEALPVSRRHVAEVRRFLKGK